VYAREIDGREFTFGVSGKLIRNVLVIYDRQTERYWSQLLGEAVEREMVGTKLASLPSLMTTWEQWREMHPNTVALDKNGRRGSRDAYDGYYRSGRAGVIGEATRDDRLFTKEFVVGVELDGAAVAYPFSALNDQPVINDVVGERRIIIIFDTESAAGVVYDRVVDGRELTFDSTDSPAFITDVETGSRWEAFSGEAVDGPLAGQRLQRVKSTRSFWFGWKDFHPDTAVYDIED
jgi:hypothetical protein